MYGATAQPLDDYNDGKAWRGGTRDGDVDDRLEQINLKYLVAVRPPLLHTPSAAAARCLASPRLPSPPLAPLPLCGQIPTSAPASPRAQVRLSMVWNQKIMLYLQLRNAPQMRAWADDLNRRAREDSSDAPLRQYKYEQSCRPDPSLAEGMLAVRKDMNRATTEAERLAAAQGIGGASADVRAAARATAVHESGLDLEELDDDMRQVTTYDRIRSAWPI